MIQTSELTGPALDWAVAIADGREPKIYTPHMTESELVQTAFAAALAAEEHECREFFQYQGKRPFQPHVSIHALMAVCDQEDVRTPVGVAA